MLWVLMKILSYASAKIEAEDNKKEKKKEKKKKKKNLKAFKFPCFIVCLSSDILAVKGLTKY